MCLLEKIYQKNQWDRKKKKVKKNHPNSVRLNAWLIKKLVEINAIYINDEVENNSQTAKAIHKKATNKLLSKGFTHESSTYLSKLK